MKVKYFAANRERGKPCESFHLPAKHPPAYNEWPLGRRHKTLAQAR